MMETVQGRKRLSDARTAAGNAYEWGWEHGGVAAPVLAPALAAGAFAIGLAFQNGGIVPGVGRGDIVPAMLEPGETVLPKGLTEALSRSTNPGPSNTTHLHYRPTFHVNTIDGDGVQGMLDKHTEAFTKHFNNEMRKQNR
jgi:hypothetical protein